MSNERKPPQNAEELLERYAAGERDFADANLSGADLSGADLSGAKLTRSNLHRADLTDADLTDAHLRDATLPGTSLHGANLNCANLNHANLYGAFLSRANLSFARFTETYLGGADLTDADLSHADLHGADLTDAKLYGARLSKATLGKTLLADINLGPLCDANPPVVHQGTSIVDFRAIIRSLNSPNLRTFLQRAGMPEVFAEYMIDCARTLTPGGVFRMLQSTFISYGGPDTDFAQKLNDALLKNGVTTFFFARDAIPGKKLHRLMREGVNQHDRVILVCSKASLDRPGVLNEIIETLQREARDGGKEYLIPITLDDYVFTGWKPKDPGVAQAIRDRVVADFKGAETDPAKFNDGLLRLIAALKK